MEWFLKKALEHPGESYSPQRVAEMLNNHTEAIRLLTNGGTVMLIMWLALAVFAILSRRNFNNRLKKLGK